MQAPCKDCPDRKFKCHSTCEKYIAFDKYRQEIRAKRMEEHELNRNAYQPYRKDRRK